MLFEIFRRKKIWHEIALLKIDNKELEDEISALGKEKPQIEDTKDVLIVTFFC